MRAKRASGIAAIAMLVMGAGWPGPVGRVYGHCDTIDGPVVKMAQAALQKGDVTPVLRWVKPEHEAEIRDGFNKTLAVRGLSPEARDLADRYFFETLVRLHRAGEGAPYTGLKPAGQVEPVIAASDKALETGSVEALTQEIVKLVSDGIRRRFAETMETKKHADENVAAGRQFVNAYVEFVHYVERLHADVLDQSETTAEPAGHQH